MDKLIFFFLLLFFTGQLSAQIAINTDGGDPDSSAILDIQSTTKGLLTPRMTEAQRNAIAGPATSLMVYQTDGIQGYYYNGGTPATPAWVKIGNRNDLQDVRTPIDSVAHFANYGSVGYANYVITEPGSYYLTKNVTSTQSGAFGIVIDADNVTLDLNGYILKGDRTTNPSANFPPTTSGGTGDGIHLEGTCVHISIKNGTVDSWAGSGISGSSTNKSSFHNLVIRNIGVGGLEVNDYNVLVECSAYSCFDSGIIAGEACTISNCKAMVNAGFGFDVSRYSKLTRCLATNNGRSGFSVSQDGKLFDCSAVENNEIGIKVSIGGFVSSCLSSGNDETGIEVSSDCIVANSVANYNGKNINSALPDSSIHSGIRVTGNGGYLFNNVCSKNEYAGIAAVALSAQDTKIVGNLITQNDHIGILVKKSGGIVVNNYVGGTVHGPGYDFRGTVSYGPIIDVRGAGSLSTVTNADHPFANYNN